MNSKIEFFFKLGLLFIFLFLAISIYTFHPLDPGIGASGAESFENRGGLVGAYLASFFFFLFGLSALLIPFFGLILFFYFFYSFSLKRLFGLKIILMVSFSLLFGYLHKLLELKDFYLLGKYPLNGGIVGELSSLIIKVIGIPGFFIVTFLLPLLSLFLFFDFPQKILFWLKKNLFQEKVSLEREAIIERDEKEVIKEEVKKEKKEINIEERSDKKQVKDFEKGVLPPPLELLEDPQNLKYYRVRPEELKERALLLKAKLKEFNIEGEVTGIKPGPVITVFEFKPAPGIKLSKILSLVDDLALGLSAKSVRILAPIPGKDVIGIEISNPHRELVLIKEILSEEIFQKNPSPLTIALGKDIFGNPVVADLRKMPHLLIAGSTGSGKSIFIHSIILSIIYKSTPEEVRFLMIDPKRIDLSVYDGIPYLLHPVVLEPKMSTRALRWAVSEMERRYSLFEELSVRNLESYNETFEEKLPYIVVIIDELADLMVISSKEVETLLTRLAQMARAAGIHLIVATQRPSVDVITGLIKVNFPARISFQVTSKVDSRTILDVQGAERLLGAGDMLFMPPRSYHMQRIHASFVSEKEIKKLVNYLQSLGNPVYLADFEGFGEEDKEEEEKFSTDYEDELYQEALKIAYQYGKISVSMLQRKLRIGYNRAARLVEKMEEEGILGPSDGVRPRPVISPRKPL